MVRKIVTTENVLGGEPRLEDTRIRVTDIAVKYDELGYSIEKILEAYERLERDDVENALEYFYSKESMNSASNQVKA